MAYGKIDWSTWTKAAMAQTIDTLMSRQTELLNQIAELERDAPKYVQLVGRVKRAQPLPTSSEDAYGGPLPFTRVPEAMQKQHEEITRTVTLSELTATQVDWSKL